MYVPQASLPCYVVCATLGLSSSSSCFQVLPLMLELSPATKPMHMGGSTPAIASMLLGIAHKPSPTSSPAPRMGPKASAPGRLAASQMCITTEPSQKSIACRTSSSNLYSETVVQKSQDH